jgi:hypothetical protein
MMIDRKLPGVVPSRIAVTMALVTEQLASLEMLTVGFNDQVITVFAFKTSP